LSRNSARYPFVFEGLLLLASLAGPRLSAQTVGQEQPDSSRSMLRSVPRQSAPVATGTAAARELFKRYCVKCHEPNGTGNAARSLQPEIPDFTASSWQSRQSEPQLRTSILDGKGHDMPSFRGKIDEDQARDLVAHVRVFSPTTAKPAPQRQREPAARGAFEEEYRRLQEKMNGLQKQLDEVPRGSADREHFPPSEAAQAAPPSKTFTSVPRADPPAASASAAAGAPADRELFRQHCMKCHGAKGTGSHARRHQPEIPDFTVAEWQGRRTDAQLLASILDGKGTDMPPCRGKISERQARGLVSYVRAFAKITTAPEGASQFGYYQEPSPPDEKREVPAIAEPVVAEPPAGCFEKSIHWLGKSHPAAVHFPIALLTAAAVAELLRLVTSKSAFDAVSRFCIWFGAVTAVGAGLLGWFKGGFQLTDASWVMMMHRWLGTSAVACAGLVLVLSEASRRPDRRRTRLCFRVTLFVVAVLVLITGFFGGAVVFGLNHYTWAQ
jgi:mono/diheme cytochrome c family protein/uncharacterized membrane protein